MNRSASSTPEPAPDPTTEVSSAKSTFELHVEALDSHRAAVSNGLSTNGVITMIRSLDAAVAAVDGHGFEPTPAAIQAELADAIGLESELWVKDETHNVSGSHKGRHLFGVALRRMVDEAVGRSAEGRFAIASCGNAALAASVVARALDHPIDVFVPTWADAGVTDMIESLGGNVVRCEREPGTSGDPTHRAMVAAVGDGGVAFSCQGTDTPSTIDGGRTLGWEFVDSLIDHDGNAPTRLDRLVIQVGGGALASSTVLALASDVGAERLQAMPTIHPVQPVGNHPFVRAWDLVVAELLDSSSAAGVAANRAGAAAELGRLDGAATRAVMSRVSSRPDSYMWPWDDEPVSYASGILDDITYDWLSILEATLVTGGWPVLPSEDQFRRAHWLGHAHTEINVCPTGASGLAGLLALVDAASIPTANERVGLLFTGAMRPGDPHPCPPE